MSDNDCEALAGQLYALYTEALGIKPTERNFVSEPAKIREAWIQVAQFVSTIRERLIDGIVYHTYETPDHR